MRFGIICIVTCCFCCFASWIISTGLKAWLPNEIVPRTHKTPKLRTHRENMLCCVNVCNALKRWLVNANKKCWRLCSFFWLPLFYYTGREKELETKKNYRLLSYSWLRLCHDPYYFSFSSLSSSSFIHTTKLSFRRHMTFLINEKRLYRFDNNQLTTYSIWMIEQYFFFFGSRFRRWFSAGAGYSVICGVCVCVCVSCFGRAFSKQEEYFSLVHS